jgi:hypothetical protein
VSDEGLLNLEVTFYLCPPCGGYDALTKADYEGGLSGYCDQCKKRCREVHKFGASIPVDRLGPCECPGAHPRRETL